MARPLSGDHHVPLGSGWYTKIGCSLSRELLALAAAFFRQIAVRYDDNKVQEANNK